MKFLIPFFLFAFSCNYLFAQQKKFSKQDSVKLNYCLCDSLNKTFIGKTKPNKDEPDFEGNGWNTLFNFQGKMAQCGYFNKFYFMYGFHFKYDENGKLTKIMKFYNGKMIGVCTVK